MITLEIFIMSTNMRIKPKRNTGKVDMIMKCHFHAL
uniref:Uncharacterized protein n=1 Tax=Rhizophora mucronata TaxID=61149 RepID=A0A2P2P281_RHIMU